MPPSKIFFENLYKKYNSRDYTYSDPISLVYRYSNKLDIEIAALIASSLAYGNVKQILKSLNRIFSIMGKSPRLFIEKKSEREISKSFLDFKHRFTTGAELSIFLINLKRALKNHGTIQNLFLRNMPKNQTDIEYSIYSFINAFNLNACAPTLFPCPEKKSSFKRLNLFLRWMVRKDSVDLGTWDEISPSKLIVPLDTHMISISQKMGITQRKDSSMKTAKEITDFFKTINPSDPVKYDFSITRTGILKNFKA